MLTGGQTSLDAAPQELLARIDGYVERLQRERPRVSFSRGDAVRDLVPPAHRALILLGELRDLSDQEIADALGITREAAKMRLHRVAAQKAPRGELRPLPRRAERARLRAQAAGPILARSPPGRFRGARCPHGAMVCRIGNETRRMVNDATLASTTATAILGIDTLWGGDVMNPSGAGRFIADSWFSDEPLPAAYTHAAAARLRETGGVGGEAPDHAAIDAYLAAVDVRRAIEELTAAGKAMGGLRGAYLEGTGECLLVMYDLVEELRGRSPPVPYERAVIGSTGRPPEPSRPEGKRALLAGLLANAGHQSGTPEQLVAAVDAWRKDRLVPRKAIRLLVDAYIALLEEGTRRHVVPHLAPSVRGVPRANIRFLAIENAWFSGSMNYVGRARSRTVRRSTRPPTRSTPPWRSPSPSSPSSCHTRWCPGTSRTSPSRRRATSRRSSHSRRPC